MNEVDKNLSKILEIEVSEEVQSAEEETIEGEIVPVTENLPVSTKEDVDRDIQYDYEISRETHRGLLEQGQEALEGILKVAKESQHPRAYEVAGNLLKIQSDMTDKLLALQEKKRVLQEKRGAGGAVNATQVNVEQAVFVGSTSDLLKQVRKK